MAAAGCSVSVDNALADTFRVGPIMAGLSKIGLAAPSLELMNSVSSAMRDLIVRVSETGLVTNAQVQGLKALPQAFGFKAQIASNIRTEAVMKAVDLHYKAYRDRVTAAGERPMKERDFLKEAALAARREDVHPVKEVSDLAKFGRQVLEALHDEAEKLGMPVPEKLAFPKGESYFPRDYLAEEINRRRGVDGRSLESIIAKAAVAKGLAQTKDEAMEIGRSAVASIMGSPSGRIPRELNAPGTRAAFKERTLRMVNDRDIAEFLNDDWLDVMLKTTKTLSHDIEFYRAFPEGYKSVDDAIMVARKEFEAIAGAAKTDSARAAIARKGEREEQVIRTLIERERGVSTVPIDPNYTGLARIGKAVGQINYMRLLGSGVLSQFSDAGAVVMSEGFARTMGVPINALVNGLGSLKVGLATARRFGSAIDFVSTQRLNATADIVEEYGRHSRVERYMDTAAKWFGMASLMTPWTIAMKAVASTLVTDRMLADLVHVAKGGERTAATKARWLAAGVTDDTFNALLKEVPNFTKEGAHWVPNLDKWKAPQEVIDSFGYALARDVNNAVLRPGAVDRPLWMTTTGGRLLTQFQGFGWAANQRLLLAGLQRRDQAVFSGWTLMLGMGILTTASKDLYNKGEIDSKRDLGGWIRDGIDRSGLLSVFMQYDNYFDKGLGLSISRTLTGQGASKYAGRGFLEQVAGPTAGFVTDTQTGLYNAITGDFTKSDLHKLFRLGPALGLPFIKQGFQAIEDASGLPERQSR